MFREEYTKQLDSVTADEYTKHKIKLKLSGKAEKNVQKSNANIIRIAAAVAASFAIVLSVLIIKKEPPTPQAAVGNTVKTYKDIYSSVEPFIPKRDYVGDFIEGISLFGNKTADEEILYEYEYATDDADGAPATGTSSQNNFNNGALKKSDNESETIVEESDDSVDKSETNTQVDGVDESDIIKTDGKYIYSFSPSYNKLRIIKAGKEPELVKSFSVGTQDFAPNSEMYLVKDRLIMIGNSSKSEETIARIYNIKEPQKTEMVYECKQSGYYNTSRMIGDKLYLISNYSLRTGNVDKDKPETFIPCVGSQNFEGTVPAEDVYINRNCSRAVYTVICAFNITNAKLCSSQSVLGGTYTLYCNTENIITADYTDNNKTNVTRFTIKDGEIEYKADGEIAGSLLNQFSIDECKGYFRFVTTSQSGIETRKGDVVMYTMSQANSLVVLDGELKKVSSIDNIAPDERVYSVRFMGDVAYFVTFRQVDPLFSVDLSDPKNPKIIGALKIPGFSNYLFPYGEGKLLGIGQDADEKTGRTGGVKLSMFDTSNPANVIECAKLILDADYSNALYGHKESLVDVRKNIIGFSVYGKRGVEYRIFGFTDGEFVIKANITFGNIYDNVRGLYIGKEFYIITERDLFVYDIDTYTEINRISLS